MVEWRVGGTTSVDVDADLRRRRESMSATLWSSSARYGGAIKCSSSVWALNVAISSLILPLHEPIQPLQYNTVRG